MDASLLAEGQILIWTTRLDNVGDVRLAQLANSLSADENQKALRLRFERDRKRFIVGRGVLREILGTYLKTNPEKIAFGYGSQGKPFLKVRNQRTVTPLHFNLSHSSGWVIYALALNEVGLDLEFVRPIPELHGLVERCFSAGEVEAFYSVPSALRLKAFFNGWTRKEAYVKACGEGLSIPLDQFDVTIDPGLPARLVSVRGIPGAQLSWTLFSFDPWPESVAALVCPRNSKPCLCGSWPGEVSLHKRLLHTRRNGLEPPGTSPLANFSQLGFGQLPTVRDGGRILTGS
jgi:4'-phosphopantetheinyl transferase